MPITKKGKQVKQMLEEFKVFRARLPQMVGTEAVSFFKQSFRRQGWIDKGGVEKWKRRKHDGRKSRSRGILMLRGTLRRSIRIVEKSISSVTVGTDVPYAQIHNEGGHITAIAHVRAYKRKGSAYTRHAQTNVNTRRSLSRKRIGRSGGEVKAHTRRMNIHMPKRQFMGQSRFFERRIQMQTERELKRILDAK